MSCDPDLTGRLRFTQVASPAGIMVRVCGDREALAIFADLHRRDPAYAEMIAGMAAIAQDSGAPVVPSPPNFANCGGWRRRINEYLAQHPECRGNKQRCPELMEMFRAWAHELNARVAALTPPPMKQGTLGGTMALQNAYGYIELKEGGRALVRVNPGQKTGYVYATRRTVPLKGKKITAVPRRMLIHKVAPSVIWNPGVSPDIQYAVQIEDVDLQGGLPFGPSSEQLEAPPSETDVACAQRVAPTITVAAVLRLASMAAGAVGVGFMFTKRKGLGAGLLAGSGAGWFTSGRLAIGAARTFQACRTAAAPRAA